MTRPDPTSQSNETDRIDRLKQLIQRGRYRPDPDDLTDSIIWDHMMLCELLGARPPN